MSNALPKITFHNLIAVAIVLESLALHPRLNFESVVCNLLILIWLWHPLLC